MYQETETYVVTLVDVQVGVHVALVSTPHGASHERPRLFEGKNALDVIAGDLFARDRINDGGFDTEERHGGASRLVGRDSTQGSDDVGAGLGLPVGLGALA